MPSGATVLRLQEVRKRCGVSLEQISERTKIGIQFLRAIETEEFGRLPGGVFNTSYIRQYAVSIGFSESELLATYAAFEQSRLQADADQQAQCAARRGWTIRCFNWLRTLPVTRAEY